MSNISESEIIHLFERFLCTGNILDAKNAYQKIIILRNHEDTNNYTSYINTVKIKNKLERAIFTRNSSPKEDIQDVLNNMCNLNVHDSVSNNTHTTTVPEYEHNALDEPDDVVAANFSKDELNELRDLTHKQQQDILMDKYFGDDDLIEHIKQRRTELDKELAKSGNFTEDSNDTESILSDNIEF